MEIEDTYGLAKLRQANSTKKNSQLSSSITNILKDHFSPSPYFSLSTI